MEKIDILQTIVFISHYSIIVVVWIKIIQTWWEWVFLLSMSTIKESYKDLLFNLINFIFYSYIFLYLII